MLPLGDRLRSARQLRGLSRHLVAQRTGVPAKAQARIERGEVQASKYIPVLLQFYGLDPDLVATSAGVTSTSTDTEAMVVPLSAHDPPVSQASFAQAWLRVLELWLQARPDAATSLQVSPGAPPPPDVVAALNTITVSLIGKSQDHAGDA